MKKSTRIISVLLSVLMITSAIPFSVFATPTRHDFTVDFDYEYDTPEQALQAARNYTESLQTGKDSGEIHWNHVSSFSNYNDSDSKIKLTSTDPDDKYIILDNDLSVTSAHTDWQEIVIKADKVLDLNGYTISLNDKRNKIDTHDDATDEYYQSSDAKDFQSVMFRIENGATLTIIDSSLKGTGSITTDAYMINPYEHRIKRYTTRDIFWVDDGNLIIYGGTYRAGRSKQQSDDDTWDKIKSVVGSAIQLATDIAGYATPINSATGKLKDVNFNVNKALEELKKSEGNDTEDTSLGSVKKDTSTGEPEVKKDTPAGESTEQGRNQTVAEKQTNNDNKTQNQANANGTAKKSSDFDGNSKIAEAQNAVVNAATNKETLTKMTDSAFAFAESVRAAFGTDEGSIVTQSFLGTVVHIGNAGTFVSYGGEYIGYGMTPNIRNAVIECTQGVWDKDGKQIAGGKAYIYDGTFEGRCGANIFNIVKANNHPQTFTQYFEGTDGVRTEATVTVPVQETAGLEVVTLDPTSTEENIKLIDTKNIRVRGGVFRNYCEYSMVGLNEDAKTANDHNSDNMTMFPGSAGSVNLGVGSYGEDLIRDGRIQVVDNHGDGALVLMDEEKDERGINHYRLYCSDEELRYKPYLTVYPKTDATTNSTYSFSLTTRYNGADTGDDISEIWSENEDNVRGVYSNNEEFFRVEIDGDAMDTYYVIPHLSDTDVYGEHLDESDVWYYQTPTTSEGEKLTGFTIGSDTVSGLITSTQSGNAYKYVYSQYFNGDEYESANRLFDKGSIQYGNYSARFLRNLKWFTYKVYRVDPLTRENLTTTYGEEQPVAVAIYGASTDDALRCRLPINKLGIDYQPGEMYRIVLTVDEYLEYSLAKRDATRLQTASCESSILFLCYSKTDLIDKGGAYLEADYTPLQWVTEPEAGKTAKVQIINGKAGQIDWQNRKIFEVYYQWFAVNPETGEETMIAGTNNIYDDISLKQYEYHKFTNFKTDDGHIYANTRPLSTDTSEWSYDQLHFYPQASQKETDLAKNKNQKLSLDNNNIFFTNSDSCYIPMEYNGYEIYVKAIVLNNFWPLNYDHRQTFETKRQSVKSITVTFEAGEGSLYLSSNEITYAVGKPFGWLPVPTKTGYAFDGWYVNGLRLSESAVVTQTKSFTATAKYSPKKLTVTLNAAGGTCGLKAKTVTYGSAYGELPTPTKSGYRFIGWSTSNNLNGFITEASLVTKPGDHTLTALWGTLVTVSFDSKGASVNPASVQLVKDAPIGEGVLPDLTGKRTGYVFNGWDYVDENGTHTRVTKDSTVKTSCTLVASWSTEITVTLNAQGGSCSQANIKVGAGAKLGTLPTPTKSGSKFVGWYTTSNGTDGVRVTAEDSFQKNTTIYAVWRSNSAKITFVTDKTNGTSLGVRYTEAGGKLPAGDFVVTPEKPGYLFKGWYYTKSNGVEERFTAQSLCYNEMTVYPKYDTAYIDIYFDLNGGKWISDDSTVAKRFSLKYLISFSTTLNTVKSLFYRSFYDFEGWFTEPVGGTQITNTTYCSYTEETTLYAHWSPRMQYYTLCLGYEDAPDLSQYKVLQGAEWGDLPVPTREGYIFDGWYTVDGEIKIEANEPSDMQTVMEHDTEYKTNRLLAHWTADGTKLTLKTKAKGMTPIMLNVTTGEPIGTLPTLTQKGYSFDGWYYEENGGEQVNSTDIFTIEDCSADGELAIYAHWTKKMYEVKTTQPQNGGVTADVSKAGYEDEVTLTVTPDYDCMIEAVYVNGESIPGTNNIFSFRMPDSNADIEVAIHKHEWIKVTEVAPTATQSGSISYYCEDCEDYKTEAIPALNASHHLTYVPQKDATLTAEGMKAYYYCSDCECYFADAQGQTLISDRSTLVIPKLTPSVKKGDIDDDGKITASDARLALRGAVGLTGDKDSKGNVLNFKDKTSRAFMAANVDKNDKLDASDARFILRGSVGLEDTSKW